MIPHVLCATTLCNFSSFIWPAFSAPAALARLLFDPPEPQNTGKTQCFATFLPFRAPASSLFWLSPSLIFTIFYLLPSDFLHVRVSSWLCFSSVHIVGSFTSKLPSIIQYGICLNKPLLISHWLHCLTMYLLLVISLSYWKWQSIDGFMKRPHCSHWNDENCDWDKYPYIAKLH